MTGEINDYDGHAQEYTKGNDTGPHNVLYERPATLAVVGDVPGLRVLDAGCGPGTLAADLIARGATVTGIDMSENLLAIARTRAVTAEFRRHDLTQPLPFPDASFDLVVSSLVMHYLEDWVPPLREIHRVLAPGGRFVFSTHHPFMDLRVSGSDDYFGTYQWDERWQRGDQVMHMRFWHRPLRAMLAAFDEAGLALCRMIEPEPDPAMAESAPQVFAQLSRRAQFLVFELARS
jgi:SAM-dependent methyltransferase